MFFSPRNDWKFWLDEFKKLKSPNFNVTLRLTNVLRDTSANEKIKNKIRSELVTHLDLLDIACLCHLKDEETNTHILKQINKLLLTRHYPLDIDVLLQLFQTEKSENLKKIIKEKLATSDKLKKLSTENLQNFLREETDPRMHRFLQEELYQRTEMLDYLREQLKQYCEAYGTTPLQTGLNSKLDNWLTWGVSCLGVKTNQGYAKKILDLYDNKNITSFTWVPARTEAFLSELKEICNQMAKEGKTGHIYKLINQIIDYYCFEKPIKETDIEEELDEAGGEVKKTNWSLVSYKR